jgi:D-alanyl-D-alanine carboxypeptidase
MTAPIGAIVAAALALTSAQRAAVDKLVTSTMEREHIAGITVVVARSGAAVFEYGFGFADIAQKKPAAGDTVYPIGSITKQFTAASVLLLAEDGKLAIDDPIAKYVPGLPWGDRITLRHLLDQESGVVDFRFGAGDLTQPLTKARVLERLKQTDLMFPPGSKYEYSNSNYYLLGMVIEKVSGKTYQQFLAQRIFAPLGLNSTYYNDVAAHAPDLAVGYNTSRNGPQPIAAENPDWAYAAGAIASTASDALRGGKLIGAESLRAMFSPGVLDNGSLTDYGFGWVIVRHNGHREIWHNGEVTGFHAMNATYPDENTDVVVLTNTGGTYAADELAVQIFDVLHPFVPSATDVAVTARVKEWLGRIVRGDVDRSQLTDQMSAVLTADVVKSAGGQLKNFGSMKSVTLLGADQDASGRSYSFRVTFLKGHAVRWVMGIDPNGKISALFVHV